ncbi:MAG: GTP-sensing pleiotropic transcriptional regulator CodY [Lachnospiraceae bacterium]|nr:GTP-sensing pleiotropic transcriptional regulator CodY [Lachnospiraceae bacterium]MCR5024057.1 GTP-sensing pleiotropic transcriptional regulator CodY [Lachnospiraceae bacterium]
MGRIELLDRIRTINGLLKKNQKGKVVFTDICECIGQLLLADVVVLSRKGKIIGRNVSEEEEYLVLKEVSVGEKIDSSVNKRLLSILSTQENVNPELLGLKNEKDMRLLVTPVEIAGKRLGTMIVCRMKESYSIDDIILCEYADTVLNLEMLRSETEEQSEEDRRERMVRGAFSALSYSEAMGAVKVLDDLAGHDGTVIASKVAENLGITRSVVVNGLKKLESAGIIETGSAGMKGTRIRIKSREIYEEVGKWKLQNR